MVDSFLINEAKKYSVNAEFKIDENLHTYKIENFSGTIIISAKNKIEMLYAIYDFAEKFNGYCFFEPGKDIFRKNQIVTNFQNGILVADKKVLLKRRGFIQEFPFDNDTPLLFDWMAKNKLNYLLVWMKYYDNLSDDLKLMAKERGITIESGHHNFNYWISGKEYAKTHPDFFAEINGKRISPSTTKNTLLLSEQLCTTNPELRAEIVANMLKYCEKNPEIKYISLIPNDGFGWCECENCQKFYDKNHKGELYNVSQHVYLAEKIYHNLIADIIKKIQAKRPDITLTLCAYVNYSRPAKGFKLTKGTAVHFAPYWRCVNHEIFDDNCPINKNYKRDILEWRDAKAGGEINIYEYYMGVNFYLSLPLIHFAEMFSEISWYAKNDIDGILTQFHIPNWNVYGINYYLMGKAARGENYQECLNLFYQKRFGEKANQAKIFYATIKEFTNKLGECHISYPYSILSRSQEKDYVKLVELAKTLNDDNLFIWCEYMLKFKQLFDSYHANTLKIVDVDNFLNWIKNSNANRVFVYSKFELYFSALKTALKNNTKWLHFNLDWEDNYILQHEKLWKK